MNAAREESLRFAVLGPVRAWNGARELDLGSPQQRVVLAALLLRRGRPVTVAELVDAVWGDEPPPAAVSVLRTYASRLRKVLEPDRGAGEPPRVVVSAANGYLVRVPEHAVDLGVFEQRVGEAKKLRAAGEALAAAELLRAALDGWEGTPLSGLPGPLAEAERSRLAEERLTTLETRLDTDVQLGRHTEVIAELTALTDEHPLREGLCRLLMLALYRSGRQAEALAAYRRTRNTLVVELGIDPGASLQELHDRILTADASLAPSPREAEPEPCAFPAARHVARPAQLPADLPTFTGRHTELKQAQDLLSDEGTPPATVQISVIGGMAGVGKTTLAVHLAHRLTHRYPDGQLYIDLRGFDPTGSVVAPGEAVRVFLDALGIPSQRVPAHLDAQAALYRSLLANRRMLILLDNARGTEQVRPLLPGSPGCLVIVTSRDQLTGLIVNEGARPLTLNPLTPAEAHDFLVRRVGPERPHAEPEATDEIITRCARLPLALAIVAARATAHPGFPLDAIAKELCDSQGSLDAFDGGDPSTDIRAVFSSSYEPLSAPAARLFRLLDLRPGPDISAPAAAALAGLPLRETRGLLAELTRAHLLTEHAPGRYTLHDLLRDYAAERLATEETPQERHRAVERLLCWYLHTADAAYAHLVPHRRQVPLGPPPPGCHALAFTAHDQALEWCEIERPNLVAAVYQAAASRRPGIVWRLAAVLWGSCTSAAICTTGSTPPATPREGITFDILGTVRHRLHHHDKAIEHYRQAIGAHRAGGNRWNEGETLGHRGDVFLAAGAPEAARTRWRQALMVFEEPDHPGDEEIRGRLRRLDERTPDAEPDRTAAPGHVAPTDTNMIPPVTTRCTFHVG